MGMDPSTDGPRIRARHRRRAAAGHARHRADRPREPGDLRPLLRPRPRRGRPARRRAPRVRPADRARQRPGRAAVGRHEAAPDDRPVADQRAEPAPPRRADDRPRPAGPPPPLGPPVPAEAARRDARPDDPLHGRGRAAVRPARRHGQGEDRRRGQPARRSSSSTRPARSPSSASRRASRRRSTASSTASPSGSSTCPTGSCSTPTTARRPSAAVHERGLRPETVLVRRSSLEDVFLRLTGRSLIE